YRAGRHRDRHEQGRDDAGVQDPSSRRAAAPALRQRGRRGVLRGDPRRRGSRLSYRPDRAPERRLGVGLSMCHLKIALWVALAALMIVEPAVAGKDTLLLWM